MSDPTPVTMSAITAVRPVEVERNLEDVGAGDEPGVGHLDYGRIRRPQVEEIRKRHGEGGERQAAADHGHEALAQAVAQEAVQEEAEERQQGDVLHPRRSA
jgi:hypothetical protein